jgi:hypothetical protein
MNDDQFIKDICKHAKETNKRLAEREEKWYLQKEFADFDCGLLSKITNKDLAVWQSKYPMDSPQYLIALQEWNRRATVEQTKWMKRSVWTGFIGIIIGAVLTAVIAWLLPPQKVENNITPQNQTTKDHTQQNAKDKKTDIKAPIRIKK